MIQYIKKKENNLYLEYRCWREPFMFMGFGWDSSCYCKEEDLVKTEKEAKEILTSNQITQKS